jgi:hypothetical protein
MGQIGIIQTKLEEFVKKYKHNATRLLWRGAVGISQNKIRNRSY